MASGEESSCCGDAWPTSEVIRRSGSAVESNHFIYQQQNEDEYYLLRALSGMMRLNLHSHMVVSEIGHESVRILIRIDADDGDGGDDVSIIC